MLHFPMLIACAIFVPIPDQADLEITFTAEKGKWAVIWYWTMIGCHAYLGLIHLATLLKFEHVPEHIIIIFQTVGILAQMFNLCMMLQLFATAEIKGYHHEPSEDFKMWMLIEMFMTVTSMINTVLYMTLRTINRGSFTFEIVNEEGGRIDQNQDFLSN